MSTRVVIGAQWGDEGKGKIVDALTESADWVVRYQGGNNAGHTVKVGEEKFVLHLIPSGVLHAGKHAVIGHGVVLDPHGLLKEIRGLEERGFDLNGRLFISDRAHIVFPYHKALDVGAEDKAATGKGAKIGTTRRGIGPTYGDKILRCGIRAGQLIRPDAEVLIRTAAEHANERLLSLGTEPLAVDSVVEEMLAAAAALRPYIADTIVLLNEALADGGDILFEGAQGTMLDIDFGSYPFVTSSSPTSGGAATGSGIAPNRIEKVYGVCKAYTTRVGEGPFPTEDTGPEGLEMGKVGQEFGATTGRPRRCGWFDAVVARYATWVNGIDAWAITKLDVLDQFETIRLCTAYEVDGERLSHMPADTEVFARCQPIYEEMPGWLTDTTSIQSYDELPAAAKSFLARVEVLTGAPVEIASVGPRRSQTIFRETAAPVEGREGAHA